MIDDYHDRLGDGPTRTIIKHLVGLSSLSASSYGVVQLTPDGTTISTLAAIVGIITFFVGLPVLMMALQRGMLWWNTRGYEVQT